MAYLDRQRRLRKKNQERNRRLFAANPPDLTQRKTCPKCGETKTLAHFYQDLGVKSGFRSRCKECENGIAVAGMRKRFYGITSNEFASMIEAQGGLCAICGDPLELDGRRTHVDHVDEDGGPRVRGILCFGCNTGLGLMRDDPEILSRAILYLLKNGGPHGE